MHNYLYYFDVFCIFYKVLIVLNQADKTAKFVG